MIQVFYHEKDLDGWLSGALVKVYYDDIVGIGSAVKLVPYDYHKEDRLEQLIDDNAEEIFFVDCSAKPETLAKYDPIIIDHHKSFIEKVGDSPHSFRGNQKVGIAGCQLVWDTMFGGKRPDLIDLLGTYDTFDNRDEEYWENEVMPFQMGMKLKAPDPSENYLWWYNRINAARDRIDHRTIEQTILEGELVLNYQENEDCKIMKNAFEVDFEGYRAIAVNTTRSNSRAFKSVWDEGKYDIMLVWYNVGGVKTIISLYTTKDDIDVSLIAKKYGGGGHRQAAGFIIEDNKAKELENFGN